MNHEIKRKIAGLLIPVCIAACIIGLVPLNVCAGTKKLNDYQKKNADIIASVCIDKWETYGVLPSVAIAQALEESSLGEHCRKNNLWGIRQGKNTYNSLESGTIAYLKVINNGYYDGAPFETSYKKQIRKILDGGYCQPEGNYYKDVVNTIESYNLTSYDDKLFKALEKKEKAAEKKRLKKAVKGHKAAIKNNAISRADDSDKARTEKQYKHEYEFVYNPSIPEGKVLVDRTLIEKGSILTYKNLKLTGIYDVIPGDVNGYYLGVGDKELTGKKVYVEVHEESVG